MTPDNHVSASASQATPATPTPSEKPKLETILAFCFGCVFCVILAYAALRSTPITNEYSFFLLRVLAAISAAGIAAVIPGMLQIEVGAGTLLAIRGAGALAVFVVIFLVNPPALLRPPS